MRIDLQACERTDYGIVTRYDYNDYNTHALLYNESTVRRFVVSCERTLSKRTSISDRSQHSPWQIVQPRGFSVLPVRHEGILRRYRRPPRPPSRREPALALRLYRHIRSECPEEGFNLARKEKRRP